MTTKSEDKSKCPRCKGALAIERDVYGMDVFCRMCGWHYNPKYDLPENEKDFRIRMGPYGFGR